MHLMHQFLLKQVDISDEDWQFFSSLFSPKIYPPKTMIIKAGETENYLSFVDRGIVRFYVEDADGNEITRGFSVEGWFMSVYSSFLTRKPTIYFGETITETHTWRIHYDDLQKIYAQLKVGEKIGRLAAEALLLLKSEREFSLHTKTAEQRYLELFNTVPHLLQHIPLKHLASYIGVTPQALSRIRKRIS